MKGQFKPPILYCGFSACYSNSDFTSKYSSSYEEALCFIVPISVITQYANGSITEEQLVDKAEVLIKGNEDQALKKVKVVLE